MSKIRVRILLLEDLLKNGIFEHEKFWLNLFRKSMNFPSLIDLKQNNATFITCLGDESFVN